MVGIEQSSERASSAGVVLTVARRVTGRSGSWRDLVAVAILELACIALSVLGPLWLKTLIDGFETESPSRISMFTFVSLFVLAWAGGGIIATWRLVYSTRVMDRLTGDLIDDVLRSELPRSATRRDADSGQTLGLLERLPFSLLVVVDGVMWRVLPLLVQVILSLSVIATVMPWPYSALLLIVLAGHAVVSWLGAVRHRIHAARAIQTSAAVSSNLGDLLRNARRVVFNGALRQERDHFGSVVQDKTKANQFMMWSLVRTAALQYGWLGLGLTGLLIAGTMDVLGLRMSLGDFVMLETYALRLAIPLSSVGFILVQSASAIGTVGQVLALASQGEDEGRVAPLAPPTGAARVELDNVSFHYPGSASGIECVSLMLEPGSFNVIVGPNGSGKSTLAQVMAGIYQPEAGIVRIAGQALTDIAGEDRHRWVLYVPQFISLLNRPLGANALYPPTGMLERDLLALLGRWQFYPDGRGIDLTQHVGELGERLSGGQVQKLELARLTGVRVPVLVLDESTSALDPASEERSLTELRARLSGTTIVIVSHRRGLAEQSDTVLFMQGGRLVGQRPHEDLIRADATYRQLWR
jgi:ATP-binding cassette, subfamily B, bacterial